MNGRNLKKHQEDYSQFIKRNKWGYFTKIVGIKPIKNVPKEQWEKFLI